MYETTGYDARNATYKNGTLDELSPGIRKIRLAIVSKGKGKSGGARVITYTICASESEGRVYLVDVYDKSDFSTVSVSILKKIISEQGII